MTEDASLGFIDEFVDEYYKQGYYDTLAKEVKDICKKNLVSEKIDALVTHRRKEPQSLKRKLRKIHDDRIEKGEPLFRKTHDCESAVTDLAGVRIAVYVPQQKEKIIESMKKWFPEGKVVWKVKHGHESRSSLCEQCGVSIKGSICSRCLQSPRNTHAANTQASVIGIELQSKSSTNANYKPKFSGYTAEHAHVKLARKQVQGKDSLADWKEDHVVEVQVVSVLLHAWAQMEHDILYKSIKAKPGIEEQSIFDAVNGLIIAAEVLLDQVHTTHQARIENDSFKNKFDLAVFLNQYMKGFIDMKEEEDLDWRMLFRLLKALRKDTRMVLRPILGNYGFQEKDYDEASLKALEEWCQRTRNKYVPFLVGKRSKIPFYIAEKILGGLPPEEEKEAQERAVQSALQVRSGEATYRCWVLLSSCVWIGQLSETKTAYQVMKPRIHDRNTLLWPFDNPFKYKYLLGAEIKSQDVVTINKLWCWFEGQPGNTIFAFVFKLARLGVWASFPGDLVQLHSPQEEQIP